MLLLGRRALVTGAGRGIGVVIARLLAEQGAAVALTYRTSADGAQTAANAIREAGGRAIVLQGDLRLAADCSRLAEEAQVQLGVEAAENNAGPGPHANLGLDILVNNAAGFGAQKRLAEADWHSIEEEIASVTKPVVLLTRAVLPQMVSQKRGKIVNLTATLVHRPQLGYGAHAMAKAAVLAYTRTLAHEMGPENITVNAVSPGMALTDFTSSLPESARDAVARKTPLRRLATAEDVARAVLFFCSPLSDMVTGAELAADGGLSML